MKHILSVDWATGSNHLLLNPRLPIETKSRFEEAWKSFIEVRFQSLIGIATSGSTGEGTGRLVVLSKEALLTSADAVNRRLKSDESDVWYRTLPVFHVGGLGILARAHRSGAKVIESEAEKWNPSGFYEGLASSGATLLSLVPTQLFDLVSAGLRSPESLRAVVIGGGRLSEKLRLQAIGLGWPVLPSYGMTECCSQVATALSASDSRMKVLDHAKIRLTEDGRIEVQSTSLLKAQISFDQRGVATLTDPKVDGWFTTEDVAEFGSDGELIVLGRAGDFVKIGGEGVVVSRLEDVLEKERLKLGISGDQVLMSAHDERLGAKIVLLTTNPEVEELVDRFNESVLPFEAIRSVHEVEAIPRSALGKLLRIPALTLVGLEPPANFSR
ncbi:MAG: AMP-binding protein [Bdellovibrionota bacterium]